MPVPAGKVLFSRDERNDPLFLARDALNEAIFLRTAERMKLPTDSDSGEDNCLTVSVTCKKAFWLREFMNELVNADLPTLTVVVPADQVARWQSHDAYRHHFLFEAEED